MNDWKGRYCVINNKVTDTINLTNLILPSQVFYEVIRVIDGVFLFLEEHIERLNQSFRNANLNLNIDFKEFTNILLKLKFENSLTYGNVKLLLFVNEKSNSIDILAYEIPYYYPSEEEYLNGVKVSLYYSERKDPNIKYINNLFQENCKNEISNKNVFEILLVDQQSFITEGSKSNVFFIENDYLFTPPSNRVLKGITRQHVFLICNRLNYKVLEKNISIKDLHKYDSVFITGTSPKVLPVNSINEYKYNVQNIVLRKVMKEFDLHIHEYVRKIKQSGYSF